MNKILLIIEREFMSRVKKKSFIIMTFLGPILMGGVLVSTILMNKVDTEVKVIGIKDDTHAFLSSFKSNERVIYKPVEESLDSAKKHCEENGLFGILYIPALEDQKTLEQNVQFFSKSQPGIDLISRFEDVLEKEINTQKYINAGIDEKKLSAIKTNVNVQVKDLENNDKNVGLNTAIGFGAGLIIYLFIFIYGAMVMRGVLEEKTSRILEVVISSVKPFQIMMGKIIGIALVALTQLVLWIVLTTGVYFVIGNVMGSKEVEKARMSPGMNTEMNLGQQAKDEMANSPMADISKAVGQINFPVVIGMFAFYFIGGYLLYSALFAAVGAAADAETDTQQFMLPVTIPLIIAYVAAASVLQNPQGNIAFWFSIIPFTSPIVMMVRIPFGVPYSQLALSAALLIAGFIFTTWLAGKIYRTGILMYGKKVSYGEILKWLRYHN